MQTILRKRVLRDLKKNAFRYVALGCLIVLCMYLIISLVGAGETIVRGVTQSAEENHLEDGQFTCFVPLSEKDMETIQDNYRDAWFVGWNNRYVAAVWVGNDDNSPMKNVTGGGLPAQIWQKIMSSTESE